MRQTAEKCQERGEARFHVRGKWRTLIRGLPAGRAEVLLARESIPIVIYSAASNLADLLEPAWR
jgi:hypothetical protein